MNPNIQSVHTSADAAQADIDALQAQLAQANATVVHGNLELTPALVAGGSAANNPGNPGVAGDAQSVPTDQCAWRAIMPHGSYQNKYWYWKLLPDATKTAFSYEGRFMLPIPGAPQALELDIQQVIGKQCYNLGFQWDFAINRLRVWDRASHEAGKEGWTPIGLPCPRWTANAWHAFKLEVHRDQNSVFYDAVTIDGTRTPLTQSFPKITLDADDMINCAVQLDGNSHGDSYRTYIYDMKLTVK